MHPLSLREKAYTDIVLTDVHADVHVNVREKTDTSSRPTRRPQAVNSVPSLPLYPDPAASIRDWTTSQSVSARLSDGDCRHNRLISIIGMLTSSHSFLAITSAFIQGISAVCIMYIIGHAKTFEAWTGRRYFTSFVQKGSGSAVTLSEIAFAFVRCWQS